MMIKRRNHQRRPHSIDAEFLHKIEEMGQISQSLPPINAVTSQV